MIVVCCLLLVVVAVVVVVVVVVVAVVVVVHLLEHVLRVIVWEGYCGTLQADEARLSS